MPDASFLSSDLFLLTLTVGLYCLGGMIYRRTRLPLLHPVLLTFVAVIVFLRCAGIGYARYQEATGVLNFALGMSVVALGYLLYEQLERLREIGCDYVQGYFFARPMPSLDFEKLMNEQRLSVTPDAAVGRADQHGSA